MNVKFYATIIKIMLDYTKIGQYFLNNLIIVTTAWENNCNMREGKGGTDTFIFLKRKNTITTVMFNEMRII